MGIAWNILIGYLLLSVLAGVILMGVYIYEDYFKPNLLGGRGRKDFKFGYHFRGRKGRMGGMSAIILFLVVCPIVNLYLVYVAISNIGRKNR